MWEFGFHMVHQLWVTFHIIQFCIQMPYTMVIQKLYVQLSTYNVPTSFIEGIFHSFTEIWSFLNGNCVSRKQAKQVWHMPMVHFWVLKILCLQYKIDTC